MRNFYLFVSLVLSSNLFAQNLSLNVIVPESDTVQAFGARYRIAANTLPTAHAFINGNEVKVYPSGAFVGLFTEIQIGDTPLRIMVKNEKGDSLYKDFIFVRSEGLKSTPKDTLRIEDALMQPSQNLWLKEGDILEVKMKATPGQKAYFDIEHVESKIPMTELLPSEANGLEGIYIGRYKIKETDETPETSIRFHFSKNFFSSVEAFSKGKVSIIRDSLPRVAEVIGKRPFLNSGLGRDRLGGAKLGYLSPGVKVIIVGKVGDSYKVELGETMVGWLPTDFAKLLPPDTPLPDVLTGSISVSGNESEDIVNVALSAKVPYLSEQVVSPSAIIVNIFGATSNTNWITHTLSAENIEQVKCSQIAAQEYQLSIQLKDREHWGYDIGYEGNILKVKIKRAPKLEDSTNVLKGLRIALDAGHGGDNDGALGATGVKEKDVNLILVQHLNDLLQAKGATTLMTRSSDTSVSMTERTDKILAFNPSILVSIHCNSIGETTDPESTKGTGIFYRYPGFKPLSDIMFSKMLELGLAPFGVTGNFNFSLNAPTQMVNILVETAFLSNPEDEMKLLDDNFRKQIAGKIVEGLEEFVRKYKR